MPCTPEQVGFYGMAQALRIRRRCRRDGKWTDETVYAITMIEPMEEAAANAQHLLHIARSHWAIENGQHHTRDCSYDEDRCQVRHPNAARVLVALRALAVFLCRQGVYRPPTARQASLPSLHRFAQAHRNQVIRWIMEQPPI